MAGQQYCLRWNNHQPNFISVFSSLLHNKTLVDVTLSAEGKHLQAHKLVLSACSSYFQSLFSINPCQHPIVILKDVKFIDLKVMVDFMYYGEVNVSQEQLPYILKTAEMLKIKGLAEMPVEPTVQKPQGSLVERTELLVPTDTTWNADNQRQSLTPSPCLLSPNSRRKRLRKSSTGSGSGSTERISEEQQSSEVTLVSPSCAPSTTVIKPDPGGFSSDSNQARNKQHSTESEAHRTSSHESLDTDQPHQITLQIPQQDVNVQHSLEASAMDMPGPSVSTSQSITVSERPISTTHAQLSQQQQSVPVMGTKRGRFLMRQPRIKRECDERGPNPEEPLSPQYLSVPHLRIERQVSDPLPSTSPPPSNLLHVPGNVLVKQHSHPLLPSQTQQLLQPSSPLMQIPPHNQVAEGDRALSPVVVVTDSMPTAPQEPTVRHENTLTAPTIRVRTEELRRSASSPSTGARSSHCPVVRPGPALGCNYCWNTVDTHGRILRRKTKYHCPECQANLCIVPCFQEYHERNLSTQTDPIALTTSVMRIIPKNSSM